MKIFISGKMQGLPNFNRREFERVEHILIRQGHLVLNPAILPDGFLHSEYIHVCKAMIDVCDAVLFLDGWEDSKGARIEREHAEKTSKILMTISDRELVFE